MKYQTVLFDMDGTLLNTLTDMEAAVNHILTQYGYPVRTLGEVRRFVGNGAGLLIFPELDGALGQRDGVAAKPAPDMVQAVLSRLGAEPGRALYVGDSEVDVDTARNAGLAMIGVSWGFRGRAALESAGAPAVADTPAQLLELLR